MPSSRDIKDCYERGQPVLVGTTSIENSELLVGHLEKEKLPHQVLNAKQHAREAEIVAQAGRPKMVTIATNMAGRGTDIVLGGAVEPQILALREDEALHADGEGPARSASCAPNGRCATMPSSPPAACTSSAPSATSRGASTTSCAAASGRQGDPGSSRFYLSLEDPLLRIFGGERLAAIMQRLKMPEGEPIEHPIVNRSIAKAQNRVESRNFDIRKQLLEYDDVANDQRRVIYQQRNELLETEDVSDTIRNMIGGQIDDTVAPVCPAGVGRGAVGRSRAGDGADRAVRTQGGPVAEWMKDEPELTDETLRERARDLALKQYEAKLAQVGPELLHPVRAQPDAADARSALARASGGARSPAPGHPPARLRAEESEAGIQARGVRALFGHARPHQAGRREVRPDGAGALAAGRPGGRGGARPSPTCAISTPTTTKRWRRAGADGAGRGAPPRPPPFTRVGEKVGRNDPCPCGSGKKYKHCHGKDLKAAPRAAMAAVHALESDG